ncbi:hypothetical protein, partial [Pseudomonas carnis]|uniref:hypothetical protein n=1 Tax=Pseudomonas carnis TaxID=2487355 RepID=UPI001F477A86
DKKKVVVMGVIILFKAEDEVGDNHSRLVGAEMYKRDSGCAGRQLARKTRRYRTQSCARIR